MQRRIIASVAKREWRSALATRWLWFYGAAISVLGGGLLWMAGSMIPAGVPAEVAGNRMLIATVNLLALLVPLMGLTAGTQCLARERDHRTLGYLLAQPVTRTEVLIGKLSGTGLALGVALSGSALILALVAAGLGVLLPAGALAGITGMAGLLALSTMALGAVLGAGAVGLARVQGALLATWLLLIVLGDLGSMGLLMTRKLPAQALLGLTFANPVHQFRVAALALVRPTLEVLGPAGLYARERLGVALVPLLLFSQVCWIAGAVMAALERFWRSRIV